MNIEPGHHGPNSYREPDPKPPVHHTVNVWHLGMLAFTLVLCIISILSYVL